MSSIVPSELRRNLADFLKIISPLKSGELARMALTGVLSVAASAYPAKPSHKSLNPEGTLSCLLPLEL